MQIVCIFHYTLVTSARNATLFHLACNATLPTGWQRRQLVARVVCVLLLFTKQKT